jgi:hypothetical protein
MAAVAAPVTTTSETKTTTSITTSDLVPLSAEDAAIIARYPFGSNLSARGQLLGGVFGGIYQHHGAVIGTGQQVLDEIKRRVGVNGQRTESASVADRILAAIDEEGGMLISLICDRLTD